MSLQNGRSGEGPGGVAGREGEPTLVWSGATDRELDALRHDSIQYLRLHEVRTYGLNLPVAGRATERIRSQSAANLDPATWTYLPSEALQARARATGIRPEQRVITYCGVGISASLGLFSLYLAGYRNLGLYDGSWEEWGTDPVRPVE